VGSYTSKYGIWCTCLNGRLTENAFKRIPANSNLNHHPNSSSNPNSTNLNPNTKAQKRFRENEMTSFFGQVSRYHKYECEDQKMNGL